LRELYCSYKEQQGGKTGIHFIKAETGQQSPRQRPDGDRRSDDGKPRDSVSDTVGNMAAGGLAKRFTVGQQVFNDFLR
jgi:hypothetical protein